MGYADLKINFESNKDELIDAFVTVLGEEHRKLITKNINNLVLIDFVTMRQYANYLHDNGIDLNKDEDFKKDLEKEKLIREKYNGIFIKKLLEQIPNNKTILSELEKWQKDSGYKTPLYNSQLNKEKIDEPTKLFILEQLGHKVNIKRPYVIAKQENNNIINETWGELFTDEETRIIGELSKERIYDESYESTLNTGTVKEKQEYFDSQNLLIKNSFNYRNVAENDKIRYVGPNISLDTNEFVPVLVFCPLALSKDENILISFIHELTHAVSVNLLDNGNIINIKNGILQLKFTRGVDIYNEDELLKDNIENLETYDKRFFLNEAVTQYIATLVTKEVLKSNLCSKLLSFNIEPQQAKFESSYANEMACFKDFFDSNFDDVTKCYLGEKNLEMIGNMEFDRLCKMATEVHTNPNLIEKNKDEILSTGIKK